MSRTVICKKLRLGKDGNTYSKKLIAEVERTNAKISESYVKEFNKNYKNSGRIYVIDEEATAKRDALIKSKATPDRDALKKQATEMGLEFKNNITTKKLQDLINGNIEG